ncbi:MAG: DsrE family protein [Planctomycetota bacterium]|jgi:hypothetical protein
MGTVFVIRNDQMGEGDRQLGRKILATCLRKLPGFGGLEAIVLYNAGVHLATKDSFVAAEITLLHERGVEILPCGTCVDHFGLRDKMLVDRISNMDEIVATMRTADKVITL